MRREWMVGMACGALALAAASAPAQTPVNTSFTYQGRLVSNGTPVNGNYDFIFRLWDAATGGNNLGASNASAVSVSNGLFTTTVDFGAAFDGELRWLDMLVRPTGIASYTPLTPRQIITAAPYAQTALSVPGIDGHSLDAADGSRVDALLVDNNGYVGIGTTTPTAPLNVVGSNPYPHARVAAAADAPYGAFLSLDATATTGGKEYLIFSTGNLAGEGQGKLIFQNQSDGVPDMAITDIGNVGVGTLSPGQKLSVAGTIESTFGGFKFPDGSVQTSAAAGNAGASNWIANGPNIVHTSSSVGVGTSQPVGLLEVTHDQTGGGVQLDQSNLMGSNFSCQQTLNNSPWQSFTAGLSGNIHSVELYLSAGIGSLFVEILTGEGTNGTLVSDSPTIPLNLAQSQWVSVSFSNPNPITAGGIYTMHIVGNGVGWDQSCTDVYAGGRSNNSATRDYRFKTYVDVPANDGSLLAVLSTGRVGIGTNTPACALDVNGTARTHVLEITGGSDIAEPFNIRAGNLPPQCDAQGASAGTPELEPGMLVVIDPDHVGELRLSSQAYDRAVAGVISGAGGVHPGLTLTQEGTPASGMHPVALSGRVWCWCDADGGGPIQPGDPLTSSATLGHAMRATNLSLSQGATIGKAMSRLEGGRGLVLVLVNLQ